MNEMRKAKKMNKKELVQFLIDNFVNADGNLDLMCLDFSNFEGNVFLCGIKTKKDLDLCFCDVGGDLYEDFQTVKGNLNQSGCKVGGYLEQACHEVKGNLFQSFQKVGGCLSQDSQQVVKDLTQTCSKVGGCICQSCNIEKINYIEGGREK